MFRKFDRLSGFNKFLNDPREKRKIEGSLIHGYVQTRNPCRKNELFNEWGGKKASSKGGVGQGIQLLNAKHS